jgi:NADPH:quinone reductase-like Zn-dependent oxidoreductase
VTRSLTLASVAGRGDRQTAVTGSSPRAHLSETLEDEVESELVAVDCIGNRSANAVRRVLKKKGTLVTVGGDGGILGLITPLYLNLVVPQRLVSFIAKIGPEDLQTLADLAAAGKLTPVVDRTYPLHDAAGAIRYLETKRAHGKVVVLV